MDRRKFLQASGVAISLPWFETFATDKTLEFPKRLAFAYAPNGMIMDQWKPKSTESLALSPTLSPLESVKEKIQVMSGLDHDKANANGDGGGDHARANATFLTGCQAKKTSGADIRVGVSIDQIAAQQIGTLTKLPSLELSSSGKRTSGGCDSGYSCAYQYNLSWRNEKTPMTPDSEPMGIFDRMFGNGDVHQTNKEAQRRRVRNQSILDFVLEDANRLKKKLGTTDQLKLDEYLYSVREVEQRLERQAKFEQIETDMERPDKKSRTHGEHLEILFDLMAVAFQTDATRISTFLMAYDGSNRSFKDIGVAEGHHALSHHRDDEEKMKKIAKIDKFYVEQYAKFINKLDSIQEGEGTLLDNCMVLMGSGISDGNRHRHNDLPVVLAGGKNLELKQGRYVDYGGVPMTNLYLSMLGRMDIDAERIGDSTGVLENI